MRVKNKIDESILRPVDAPDDEGAGIEPLAQAGANLVGIRISHHVDLHHGPGDIGLARTNEVQVVIMLVVRSSIVRANAQRKLVESRWLRMPRNEDTPDGERKDYRREQNQPARSSGAGGASSGRAVTLPLLWICLPHFGWSSLLPRVGRLRELPPTQQFLSCSCLVTQPHDVAILGSQVRNLLSLRHYDDHRKFPGEEQSFRGRARTGSYPVENARPNE